MKNRNGSPCRAGVDSKKTMTEYNWTEKANLLFIVGCPRSGTTWLQAMIASHPCVATGPETHFFEAIEGLVRFYEKERPRPDGLKEYLAPEEFYAELRNFFFRITSKIPAPEGNPKWFLEKTPQHVLYMDDIIRLFPEAYFIHLVRDPRNVVASILRAAKTWGKGWFPDSAMIAAQLWRRSVEEAHKIPQKIAEPHKFLELKYEDLRSRPEQTLSKVFSWLRLDYTADFVRDIVERNKLDKIKSSGQFESVKFPQKKKAAEPQGFFGSGTTSKRSLSRLQKYQVELICAELLKELGYEENLPSVPFWARVACSWRLRQMLGLKPV